MRLIDADALIKYIPAEEVVSKMAITNAPTVDPLKWIPVSERLPNGQTEVIVSCCDDAGDSKYNYTSCGWMTRDGEYWIVDNEINYYVNAWMPLPEPWRGEADGNHRL